MSSTRGSSTRGSSARGSRVSQSPPDPFQLVPQKFEHGVLAPAPRTGGPRRGHAPRPLVLLPTKLEPIEEETDEEVQLALGYAQELERATTLPMTVAFNIAAVTVLTSISVSWPAAIATGGPVVLIWGWVICSFFTITTGFALAELAAAYPAAGAVYHWAAMLADAKYSPAAAFYTGTFNLLGNASGGASIAWAFASFLASTVALWGGAETSPLSNSDTHSTMGIAVAAVVSWGAINMMRTVYQGIINIGTALSIVCVIIAITIAITVIPGRDPDLPLSWVWTTMNNEVGVPSTHVGYLIIIGLLQSSFSFAGYEACAHLAEETKNASRATAVSIVVTVCVTAATGFALIVSMCYALPSFMGMRYAEWVSSTLATSSSDRSMEDTSVSTYLTTAMSLTSASDTPTLYFVSLGWNGGAALSIILVLISYFTGVPSVTVTSRIAYAMARDGAFPASRAIAYVWPVTKAPFGTIVLVTLIEVILLLLVLVTTQALFAVLSICVVGFQVSYLIPILLRLYRASSFMPSPAFSLGAWSMPIHAVAALWLSFSTVILFFPASLPVVVVGIDGATTHDDTMNWCVIVVAVTLAFSTAWWVAAARHSFKGPLAAAAAAAAALQDKTSALRFGEGGDRGRGLSVAVSS